MQKRGFKVDQATANEIWEDMETQSDQAEEVDEWKVNFRQSKS